MSARFTDAEAEAIDAARGGVDRGPWLRLAALAAAGHKQPPADPLGIKIITDERMPPGTAALISRGRDGVSVSAFSLGAGEPEPQQDTDECSHPKKDRLKGRCARCRTFVGYD